MFRLNIAVRNVDSLLGVNITERFVCEKMKEILVILLNSYRKHGGCYSIPCENLNFLPVLYYVRSFVEGVKNN